MCRNYQARMLQLLKPMCYSQCLATRKATTVRNPCIATKSSPHLLQLEKAHTQQ